MNVKTLTVGGAMWLVLGAAMALGSPSCRSYNAYCTEAMDCQDGNENDIEACEVSSAAEEDRAAVYGCSSEFHAFVDCVEAESDCENDIYTPEDNCDDEAQEYGACIGDDIL